MKRRIPERQGSVIQAPIGIVLAVLAGMIIAWNEGTAIEATKSLSTVFQDLRTISNVNKVDPNNDGALVYISGPLQVEEPLTEPDYGISIPAVSMKKRVQMYQWIEEVVKNVPTNDGLISQNQYEYRTDWKDKLVDSKNFQNLIGHQNPERFPVKSRLYTSDIVRIGSYVLSAEIKKKFIDFVLVTSDERPEKKNIKLHAGLYYHSDDVWNPQVGDIRVQFSFAGPAGDVVSIIAKQVGNMLLINNTSPLLMVKGKVEPEMMAKNHQSQTLWSVRFHRTLGWICFYTASSCFKPLVRRHIGRYKGFYDTVMMDGLLSPHVVFSTFGFTFIVSLMWSFYYDIMIGTAVFMGSNAPHAIYAIYRKIRDRGKPRNEEYKEL